jgi:AcrR family transcriptional regulator
LNSAKLVALPARTAAGATASPFHKALVDLCYESDFARLTVGDLCRRSGCARSVFHHRYGELQDCLLEVAGLEFDRCRRLSRAARADATDWRSRLRTTTYVLHRFLAEDPRLRHLLMVELRAAGERPAQLVAAEVKNLADLIDEGRGEPGAPASLTSVTAEALAGAIFQELYLAPDGDDAFPSEAEWVPTLMYAAVLPYAGAGSAAEELLIPPPS